MRSQVLIREAEDGGILVRSGAAFVHEKDGLLLSRSHEAVLVRDEGVFVRIPLEANFYDDVDSEATVKTTMASKTERVMDLDSKSKTEKRLSVQSDSRPSAPSESDHATPLKTDAAHRKPVRGLSSVEVRRG